MAGKNRTPKEDGRARKGAAALPFAVDRRKPGSLVDQLADGLRQAILSLQERFVRAGYLFTRVSASDGRAGADRGEGVRDREPAVVVSVDAEQNGSVLIGHTVARSDGRTVRCPDDPTV